VEEHSSSMSAQAGILILEGSEVEEEEEGGGGAGNTIILPWTFTIPLPLLDMPSVQATLSAFYGNVKRRVRGAAFGSSSGGDGSSQMLCWARRMQHPESAVL